MVVRSNLTLTVRNVPRTGPQEIGNVLIATFRQPGGLAHALGVIPA
jgi:hypothetical protein